MDYHRMARLWLERRTNSIADSERFPAFTTGWRERTLPYFGWLLLVVALLFPLVVTPIVPLIDLYNHIARFYVLSHIDSDPFLAANYASNWRLLPNLGLDIPGVIFSHVIAPKLLAKLIVASIIALQFGGTLFLNYKLTGQVNRWCVLLAAALCYSYILNWGFVNYLLANAISFWTLGIWVSLRRHPLKSMFACTPLATLVLLCHGFAFGIYGLIAAGLELGYWLETPTRKLVTLIRQWSILGAQAVIPIILFSQMATFHAEEKTTLALPSGLLRGTTPDVSYADRLFLQVHRRLEAVLRVAETPWLSVDIALFIVSVAILIIAHRRGWLRIASAATPALLLLMTFVLFLPNGMFGAGHLFERMPLVLGMTIAATFWESKTPAREARSWIIALLAVTLIRLGIVDIGWLAYRKQAIAFAEVTSHLPSHAIVAELPASGSDTRDGLFPRCQMLAPLTVIANHAASPLFADETQQPLLLRPPLAEISGLYQSDKRQLLAKALGKLPTYSDDLLIALANQRKATHILSCDMEHLTRPLPSNVQLVTSVAGISLLRVIQ